jgi:hypothetical protein
MTPPRTHRSWNLSLTSLVAVALLAISAQELEAQLNLNGGASYAEALGGQWGVEGRIGFYPPAFPVDLFAGGEYFFASCPVDCALRGWWVGGTLHSTTPGFQPYLTAAYVGRKWERADQERSKTGKALGAGVRVGVWKLRMQVELTREFLGGDLDQWVFRIGTG